MIREPGDLPSYDERMIRAGCLGTVFGQFGH
jgi:hypothetical protein